MEYEENLTGNNTIGISIRLEQYMELVKKSDMLGLLVKALLKNARLSYDGEYLEFSGGRKASLILEMAAEADYKKKFNELLAKKNDDETD